MRLILSTLFLICTAAQGQSSFPTFASIDAQLAASHAQLKQAIIGLRDARMNSCKFSGGHDCDLAELSGIELTLMDLETKYWRAERAVGSTEKSEKYKKLKEAAAEARSAVSDLASKIDEVLK
jgi:hypothetical protein